MEGAVTISMEAGSGAGEDMARVEASGVEQVTNQSFLP